MLRLQISAAIETLAQFKAAGPGRTLLKKTARWLIVWAGVVVCTQPVAGAIDFKATNRFDVSDTSRLTNELWLVSSNISIRGHASKDLFLMSQSVTLSGSFAGDVWTVAERVELSGNAGDSVRVIAKSVCIEGRARSLMSVAESIQIGPETVLEEGAILVAQHILFQGGTVNGPARLVGEEVTLNGTFSEDLYLFAQDVVIKPGTTVKGTLYYTTPRKPTIPTGAVIGQIEKYIRPATEVASSPKWLEKLGLQAWLFTGALITAAAFLFIFPAVSMNAVVFIKRESPKCLLIGLLMLGLIPLICLFMAFTLIGLPFSGVLLLFYLILLYVAKFPVAIAIGSLILNRHPSLTFGRRVGYTALGLGIIYLGTAAPFVGFLIQLYVATLGLGAIVLTIFQTKKATEKLTTSFTKAKETVTIVHGNNDGDSKDRETERNEGA